jgi:aminopeptidase-like protein
MDKTEGDLMYGLMRRLFPICRSITGKGIRNTLKILQEIIPLEVHEIPTGTPVFDWQIPKEWNIKNAYILDPRGNKIVDFKKSNLHVVGYSTPVDKYIELSELQNHLYSIKEQPKAIPYITSYYKENWGFCISHNQRKELKEGTYKVFIDSELTDGSLTYGELILPGQTNKEIFLSTYICHPSMANNELSGPVVTTLLAKWIMSIPRKYKYRIIFIPETIGSITYLSKNLDEMKRNLLAGFNINCVGDERTYSYLPSRYGNTLADKVALNILHFKCPDFKKYAFLERGSDERQYCSPGVDLPVVSIMRSKYGEFPEYHTSLDNMDIVSPHGLQGSYDVMKDCIEVLENNEKYHTVCYGEPQLSKHGLYPVTNTNRTGESVKDILNFLAYADGSNDLIDISNIINVPAKTLLKLAGQLYDKKLIEKISL